MKYLLKTVVPTSGELRPDRERQLVLEARDTASDSVSAEEAAEVTEVTEIFFWSRVRGACAGTRGGGHVGDTGVWHTDTECRLAVVSRGPCSTASRATAGRSYFKIIMLQAVITSKLIYLLIIRMTKRGQVHCTLHFDLNVK